MVDSPKSQIEFQENIMLQEYKELQHHFDINRQENMNLQKKVGSYYNKYYGNPKIEISF